MSDKNEFELFREMMSDVAPIKQDTVEDQTGSHQPTEAQLARQQAAQKLANSEPEYLSLEYAQMVKPDEVMAYKRDGVQDGVFRKLRLGKYDVNARLDLHKMSLEKARDEILRFLKQCQRMDVRTVIIVHGKGERSNPQAMMKSYVCQWLQQISDVLCYHSTLRHQGGTGALYVMIKKSQEKKLETRERHLSHRP
ncbi:DNA endonuclease SmrA [Salinivibrio kushneri]|uniref:DNA endonuclease SmrA n=1 Tax=Salinivibrio kushneri TaxID=1908198 RepID=UPI000985248A|nr:DNA endonuclease SmrA [Salinivibrio kushneri]OOE53648.1 DNA endonuclease SmrA [Salinivibrio kushneri]OOE54538.1 DNA endonuclease SmrA [Salinivibrio kushneri]OOE63315.1 DNA endonuclease SmrA [Salinivibrio kushneri]